MNRIFWQSEFEDLPALDAWQKKLASDPGYRELSFHAKNLFDQDSLKDEVLVSLS